MASSPGHWGILNMANGITDSHYCSECGSYKARKPLVELEYQPSMRGWVAWISTPLPDGGSRVAAVAMPDMTAAPWIINQARDVPESEMIASPWVAS